MTSPGGYSAGTAYLDVIPSFRGVQEAIAREVRQMERALGKEGGEAAANEMVRAVDKALGTTKEKVSKAAKESGDEYAGRFTEGFKKAITNAQREFKTIKFDYKFDDADLQKRFRSLKSDMERLSKMNIGANMDAGPALREIGRVENKLRQLQDAATELNLRTNLGAVAAEFEAFRRRIEKDAGFEVEVDLKAERSIGLFEKAVKKRIEAALSNFPPIEFDADVTPAQRELMLLRKQMVDLSRLRIGVDIDGAQAIASMEAIRRALATLATDETVDVQVRTDAAAAATELLGIHTLAKIVDKTKVEIEVEAKTDNAVSRLARFREKAMGTGADGQEAANGFRAFNLVVLGTATVLPGIVPVLTAVAGGLALLGPLALGAGAGLAVLGIGFSGIGDAVSALGKKQENAAKDSEAAAKRITSASRAVEDAQRGVERAEQTGARSIAAARREVDDARQNAARVAEQSAQKVADAVGSQQDAEEDLARAQREVQRAQEDLTQARADAQDRIEDLRISIIGGALAEREAILDLADAQEAYDAAVADPGATAEERERLLIDLEQQRLRVEQLGIQNGRLAEQQAEVARTGVEGSEEVRGAQERLRGAQEGVADAQQRVGDAVAAVAQAVREGQQAQSDAAQQITDAVMNQQQVQQDAAIAIQDAQRNLTQAQQDYTAAISETSASTQALETAMGKLGPAGQQFAIFWSGLLPQFREMRDLVQAGMFPGLEDAITRILSVNGPLLADFMSRMGQTLGDLFRQFGEMMTSPQWMGIWATFNEYAPRFMEQFGQVGMAMLTFFGELFQGLAPYSERFGDALVRLADSSARWMASFTESQTFRDIMEWLFTNGPIVFDHIWNIVKAIGNILVSLEPLGMLVLGVLGNISELIAGMDPVLLGSIVTAILGLVVAFQLAAGAIALVSGALAILTTPISLVVFLIAAVVTALIVAYTQSETFRDIVDSIFRAIGNVVVWLWDNVLKPFIDYTVWAWGVLADAMVWAWDNVLKPMWDAFVAVLKFLWDFVVKPVFDAMVAAWEVLSTAFMWVWDNVLNPLWEVFKGALQILLAFLTVAIFGPLAAAWFVLSEGFKIVYEGFLKPVWEAFKENVSALMDFLQPTFALLGEIWEGLLVGLKWIYDQILYPYIIQPFMDALSDLKTAFEVVVDAIGVAWGWLKDVLAKPVNFVIHYILNKGLFGAFNWIIDTLGLNADWKIDPWGQVGDPSTHYAYGGRVAGHSPSDRADNIPAMLTAGEWVQPVDSVRYYGPEFMEMIRKKRIPRESLEYLANGGFVQHRATGGQIFDVTRSVFPRAKLNSSYRPGDSGYHGRNMAADLGEAGFSGGMGRQYMAMMKRWWVDNFGARMNEVIYNGAFNDRPNIKDGRAFPYSAATQLQHFNHLHLALASSIASLGAVGGASAFAGVGASGTTGVDLPWWRDIWNTVTDVFGSIKDSVVKPIADFGTTFGNNPMVKMIGAMPGKAIDWVWGKIKDTVGALFFDDRSATERVTQTEGGVQNVVKAVAQRYGWDQGNEWNALYTLIQKESSWNPNAQNPRSTAYGLFQFLNGTWADYGVRKTGDPAGQAQAGLSYISRRYGSPTKALAFHRANNWYSEGGPVEAGQTNHGAEGAPTLYDTGGWLPPGITTVLNATNKPEPILTGQQWEDLTASRADGDFEQRGIRDLHLHEVQADLSEAVGAVNHWVRVYSNGGRYVGAGSTS